MCYLMKSLRDRYDRVALKFVHNFCEPENVTKNWVKDDRDFAVVTLPRLLGDTMRVDSLFDDVEPGSDVKILCRNSVVLTDNAVASMCIFLWEKKKVASITFVLPQPHVVLCAKQVCVQNGYPEPVFTKIVGTFKN